MKFFFKVVIFRLPCFFYIVPFVVIHYFLIICVRYLQGVNFEHHWSNNFTKQHDLAPRLLTLYPATIWGLSQSNVKSACLLVLRTCACMFLCLCMRALTCSCVCAFDFITIQAACCLKIVLEVGLRHRRCKPCKVTYHRHVSECQRHLKFEAFLVFKEEPSIVPRLTSDGWWVALCSALGQRAWWVRGQGVA